MKTVLLTGATGFLGRNILKVLNQKKMNIILVIRSGSEKKINLKNYNHVKKIVISKDIFKENVSWWQKNCIGVDVIIHAAWYTKPGEYLNSYKNKDCLKGSINLAKGAVKAKVKKLIGVGTCLEYDLTYNLLSIDTPLKPITLYAKTKTSLFKKLLKILGKNLIKFSWCRVFYLYGQGEHKDRLVPYINRKLRYKKKVQLKNYNSIRDYLNVSKAAMMIVKVINNDNVKVINICSGRPITIKKLAEQIANKYNRRHLLHYKKKSDNFSKIDCIVGVPNCNL